MLIKQCGLEAFSTSKWSVKMKYYYLGKNYPNVYLSYQEARCVLYFLKGFNHKKISEVMHLSQRTVDFYVHNIYAKMLCNNQEELLKKIAETDFISYLTTLEQIETSY
jgi:DNA-binding NarL/FixJ family response regulator